MGVRSAYQFDQPPVSLAENMQVWLAYDFGAIRIHVAACGTHPHEIHVVRFIEGENKFGVCSYLLAHKAEILQVYWWYE